MKRLAVLFLALLAPLASASLRNADGESTTLRSQLAAPSSLVLVIRSEAQLQEAFRLLTLAESRQLHCLILLDLSGLTAPQAALLRRAAKRYLSSDFSRERILFAEQNPLPTGAQAALFAPDATESIWTSQDYPSAVEFEAPPFRNK